MSTIDFLTRRLGIQLSVRVTECDLDFKLESKLDSKLKSKAQNFCLALELPIESVVDLC